MAEALMLCVDEDGREIVSFTDSGVQIGDAETGGPCPCPKPVGGCTNCGFVRGYNAVYWNGEDLNLLSPPATLDRLEEQQIDWDFSGSPGPGINADNWTAQLTFDVTLPVKKTTSGTSDRITFYLTSQHGVKMFISAISGGGTAVIDQWTDHSTTTHTYTTPTTLPFAIGDVWHFTIQYRSRVGQTVLKLEWESSDGGIARQVIPLRLTNAYAYYVRTMQLDPFRTTSVGGIYNYIWGSIYETYFPNLTMTPGTGDPNDTSLSIDREYTAGNGPAVAGPTYANYSYRYESHIIGPGRADSPAGWFQQVSPTTDVTFWFTHQDGARLWLNDELVVDNWVDGGPTEHTFAATMKVGHLYKLKIDTYRKTGAYKAKLEWAYPGQTRTTVPAASLKGQMLVDHPTEDVVTFAGVTIDTGCREAGGGWEVSGSLSGTFCLDRSNGACGHRYRENPGTTIVSQTRNTNCVGSVSGSLDFNVDLGFNYGSRVVTATAGPMKFFDGTAESFDCTETTTHVNTSSSTYTATGSRGSGGTAIVTPGQCSE